MRRFVFFGFALVFVGMALAADVVVRFDESPNRLVFWQGTSYIPAWVNENGIWYTNEFYETQHEAMETGAEPMADKQARFSHLRILESNEARVVMLWRYAPVSVNYDLVIVDPRNVAIDFYAGEIIRERSVFPWWNHWPVSQQIRSSGRWAVAPDRVSHSSLAHIQSWRPYEETDDGVTMIMLNGLTEKPATALLPLAKSWLSPPRMEIAGDGFAAAGYDPTQQAYVLSRRGAGAGAALSVVLRASEGSPVVNPVLLVRGWGASAPRIEIDGRPALLGPDVRAGHVCGLESDDLVLWIQKESAAPVRISVSPAGGPEGK